MKIKLPILAVAWVVVWLSELAVAQTAPVAPDPSVGRQMIETAAERLHNSPPLEARIVKSVNVFGHRFKASGSYLQFGRGTGKVRMTLEFVEEQETLARIVYICDGESTFRELRDGPRGKTHRVINLNTLTEQSKASPAYVKADPPARLREMCGLSRLLNELAANFDFSPPRAATLGTERIPVWVLRGTWRSDSLKKLSGTLNNQFQRGDFDRLAATNGQFPHEVELTLTRDEPLALFPRRLVYFHKTPTKSAASTSSNASTPILDYKLFDIRQRPDLTAEAFELDRDQNLDDYEKLDETTEFLRNLGL